MDFLVAQPKPLFWIFITYIFLSLTDRLTSFYVVFFPISLQFCPFLQSIIVRALYTLKRIEHTQFFDWHYHYLN